LRQNQFNRPLVLESLETPENLANGQPDYIGGMRGLVERNTMRY